MHICVSLSLDGQRSGKTVMFPLTERPQLTVKWMEGCDALMPARRMRQSKEIKEIFYQRIREKVRREKELLKGRVDEELPSWVSWAFKPMVGLFHDLQTARNNGKGEDGESSAFLNLWLLLPNDWVIINNVVLEPELDEFAQLDHLLIGPPGVFIIETKAWDGAFTGYKDNWKRKEGNGWVRCSSPTRQNKRHLNLFIKWLVAGGVEEYPPNPVDWVFPVVVFTKAKWLKVTECFMPVFDGALGLSLYIRRKTKEQCLSKSQVDAIAEAVASASPFAKCGIGSGNAHHESLTTLAESKQSPVEESPAQVVSSVTGTIGAQGNIPGKVDDVKVERRQTKGGRHYVRIHGSKEEAQEARAEIERGGERVGSLNADMYNRGAWYFYLD